MVQFIGADVACVRPALEPQVERFYEQSLNK